MLRFEWKLFLDVGDKMLRRCLCVLFLILFRCEVFLKLYCWLRSRFWRFCLCLVFSKSFCVCWCLVCVCSSKCLIWVKLLLVWLDMLLIFEFLLFWSWVWVVCRVSSLFWRVSWFILRFWLRYCVVWLLKFLKCCLLGMRVRFCMLLRRGLIWFEYDNDGEVWVRGEKVLFMLLLFNLLIM